MTSVSEKIASFRNVLGTVKSSAWASLIVGMVVVIASGVYSLREIGKLRQSAEEAQARQVKKAIESRPPVQPASNSSSASKEAEAVSQGKMRITGGPDFEKNVMDAMALMLERDPDTFRLVRRYIFVIRLGSSDSLTLESDIPTLALTDADASRSSTWCAGIIARYAYYASLNFSVQKKSAPAISIPKPGEKAPAAEPVNPLQPPDVPEFNAAEAGKKAAEFQRNFLRAVGAPREEYSSVQ